MLDVNVGPIPYAVALVVVCVFLVLHATHAWSKALAPQRALFTVLDMRQELKMFIIGSAIVLPMVYIGGMVMPVASTSDICQTKLTVGVFPYALSNILFYRVALAKAAVFTSPDDGISKWMVNVSWKTINFFATPAWILVAVMSTISSHTIQDGVCATDEFPVVPELIRGLVAISDAFVSIEITYLLLRTACTDFLSADLRQLALKNAIFGVFMLVSTTGFIILTAIVSERLGHQDVDVLFAFGTLDMTINFLCIMATFSATNFYWVAAVHLYHMACCTKKPSPKARIHSSVRIITPATRGQDSDRRWRRTVSLVHSERKGFVLSTCSFPSSQGLSASNQV